MGLGLHGGGIAVVNWLVKQGAQVTVTDLKTKAQLLPALKKINPKKVSLVLGKHRVIDFKNADIVVQNPGVPRHSKFIKMAEKSGITIENDASLFFKNCPAEIIGVTGTRGKSTVSALIYELLKTKLGAARVYLAGLPQQPMLDILDKLSSQDQVVLELSSWQLEILGRYRLSPHISLVTNIYPDHLNRYQGLSDYARAKENIFKYQTKNDIAVFNYHNPCTRKMGHQTPGQRLWFNSKLIVSQSGAYINNNSLIFQYHGRSVNFGKVAKIKLPGRHNLENILAALAVAGLFNVSAAKVKKVLTSYVGLPGRNQLIRERAGVKYVNDTTATTPDAVLAALDIWPAKKIVLIAGGASKKIPAEKIGELAKKIRKNCKSVILFSGEGSDELFVQLNKIGFKAIVKNIDTMSEAIYLSTGFAKSGEVVLLSPGCSSFSTFVNEYDRGDQFNGLVNKL